MKRVFLLIVVGGLIACNHSDVQKRDSSLADKTPVNLPEAFPNTQVTLSSWSSENTIVYHVLGEPDDMHPTNGGTLLKSFIFSLNQAHLLEPDVSDPTGLKPYLVESLPIETDNGLTYAYRLLVKPKWDDQTPISVKDVVFSFKAAKCPLTNNPHFKPYLENLQTIEVDSADSLRFIIRMKERNVLNLAFVTGVSLMQESYWDSLEILREFSFVQFDDPNLGTDSYPKLRKWANDFNDAKFSRNPDFLVGLGPYNFQSWKPGQSFELVRKRPHWTDSNNEPNGVDKIIFKINADPNSQKLEFKTQVLDGSQSLSAGNLIELQRDSGFVRNYNFTFLPSYTYSYLGFNCRPDGIKHQKLFDDLRVRKAVALAIPYDEINLIVNDGKKTRISGPVSPLKNDCNREIPLVQFDLDKARLLLDEAGWVDTDDDNVRDKLLDGVRIPFKFDLNYSNSPTSWKTQAFIIAESLREIGIECNPVQMSFAVLRQKNKLHDFDAMLSAWASSSFPEDYSQIWGTKSWVNQGSNYVGFGNADTDMLIDSINASVNLEERKQLLFRLQELIVDQQPYAFLFAGNKRIVAHKRFSRVSLSVDPPNVFLNEWQLSESMFATDSR